jgi:ubiquinone/menaquinone biosynthesis C-methylase UbiE
METRFSDKIIPKTTPPATEDNYKKISDYYDIAGPDYASWSRNFNMHFGYCRKLTDIFFLERMLMNMNQQVLNRLELGGNEMKLIDLGCGVATVARYISNKFPNARITGVTISDWQIQKARQLNAENGLQKNIFIEKNNFENLSYPSESFSHAYAVESACHANGSGKDAFVSEMARVLKPGGKFCMVDGFLKTRSARPRFFNYLYRKVIRWWALPCFGNIDELVKNMKQEGFVITEIKELSWRIAPSVAYVPWTCLKFFAKEIWRNKGLRMKKERWHNVYAPVIAMILGLYRRQFGYYLIAGYKK